MLYEVAMCFHPDSEMDQSTRGSGKGKIFKHLQISPVRLVQRYVPDGFQPSRLLQHFLIRHALACLIPDTAAVGEAEAGEDALHVEVVVVGVDFEAADAAGDG